ncbi:MAG: iron-containing alcohol dehydrogenase [Dethiobacteria bacterium]
MYISKFVAPEIIFGKGSLSQVGASCKRLGASRVFLVADQEVMQCGWIEKSLPFLQDIGLHYQIWSGFSANPKDFEIEEGARLYSKTKCDTILAIGGGSTIDAAKAVATLSTNKGKIQDYEGIDLIHNPLPPLVVIPSTAGSGSEVSQFSIIVDSQRKIKMMLISKSLVPDIAISDPLLLSTVNSKITTFTGMEALSHAIEAFLSLAATDLTNVHALHAIKLISANLRASVASQINEKAKAAMAIASLQAGLAFSNAVLGLVHAMSHQVGGLLDLPMGTISAILLPYVLRFNLISSMDKYVDLARSLGARVENITPREAAEKAIAMIKELSTDLKIPLGLSELGLTEEVIPDLSKNALKDACYITNPREAGAEEIMEIFFAAL